MLEVVNANLARAHIYWKNLSSTLITISTCKELKFRRYATEVLG